MGNVGQPRSGCTVGEARACCSTATRLRLWADGTVGCARLARFTHGYHCLAPTEPDRFAGRKSGVALSTLRSAATEDGRLPPQSKTRPEAGQRAGFGTGCAGRMGWDATLRKPGRHHKAMGYDFMFMTVRGADERKFPLECSEVSPADQSRAIPWPAFKGWLLSRGGRENGGENSIWVDYANDGSINFSGNSSSVYLDTHSNWDDVLAAYRALKVLEQDVAIFDLQDGRFHDELSFTELLKVPGGIATNPTLSNSSVTTRSVCHLLSVTPPISPASVAALQRPQSLPCCPHFLP